MLQESKAYKKAPAWYTGGSEEYNSEEYINYVNKKIRVPQQSNQSGGWSITPIKE